jgi:hypothetical protein
MSISLREHPWCEMCLERGNLGRSAIGQRTAATNASVPAPAEESGACRIQDLRGGGADDIRCFQDRDRTPVLILWGFPRVLLKVWFPPIATISLTSRQVRVVPEGAIAPAT